MHYTFKGNNGSTITLQCKEDIHRQIYINARQVSYIIDSTSKDNRIFLLTLGLNGTTHGIVCYDYLDKEAVLKKLIDLINSVN